MQAGISTAQRGGTDTVLFLVVFTQGESADPLCSF